MPTTIPFDFSQMNTGQVNKVTPVKDNFNLVNTAFGSIPVENLQTPYCTFPLSFTIPTMAAGDNVRLIVQTPNAICFLDKVVACFEVGAATTIDCDVEFLAGNVSMLATPPLTATTTRVPVTTTNFTVLASAGISANTNIRIVAFNSGATPVNSMSVVVWMKTLLRA